MTLLSVKEADGEMKPSSMASEPDEGRSVKGLVCQR